MTSLDVAAVAFTFFIFAMLLLKMSLRVRNAEIALLRVRRTLSRIDHESDERRE